jgi:hypothetical protein
MDQIADAEAQALLTDFVRTEARIGELTADRWWPPAAS